MDFELGVEMDHPIYKYIHDWEAMPSSYPDGPYYLMMNVDVETPAHPQRRRIFVILMQYSEQIGQGVAKYPAHIKAEDMPEFLAKFTAFVNRCTSANADDELAVAEPTEELDADDAIEHPLWYHPGLAVLNSEKINWCPHIVNCEECVDAIPDHPNPVRCSYASTLAHFERVMGDLPRPRVAGAKIVMLFLDPPARELPTTCGPRIDPKKLPSEVRRYFCLSKCGWDNLELAEHTESLFPVWPTHENAHHYLRRYFHAPPEQWSYDAIFAYFFYLFRPEQGYITNLAKCYFREDLRQKAYKICSQRHLKREIELFQPTLVLSFTSAVRNLHDLRARCGLPELETVVLQIPHPAARCGRARRKDRVAEAIKDQAQALEELGYNADKLATEWACHAEDCIAAIDEGDLDEVNFGDD